MTPNDDENRKPIPEDADEELSSQDPAEGADDTAPPTEGSPKG